MPHPPSLCLCVAVVLASLSIVQSCFTDAVVNGGTFKTADPCQCNPTNAPLYRCDPRRPPLGNAQRDPLSTTIILPSDVSAAPGGVATSLPAAAPGVTFTLRGRDLVDRLTQPGVAFNANAGNLFLSAPGATDCPAMNSATTNLAAVNVAADGESLTFSVSQVTGWTTAARTVETAPRLLCYAYAAAPADVGLWTGFRVAVAWNCDNGQATSDQNCNRFNPQAGTLAGLLSTEQQAIWNNRTVCCKGSSGLQVGVCVNPRTHTCCGGIPVQPNLAKCCNAIREWVQYPEEPCWCSREGSVQTPPDCPTSEPHCCLPTKYPEFNYSTSAVGQCYNASLHRCCNTGQRYDPGSDQCCSINGLQTLNFPCPCGADTDCRGGQTVPENSNLNQTLDHQCCKQTDPTPWETEYCSIYANYPTGTGSFESQRCLGTCFDPSYQLCCNGVTCIRAYEKCCNATCCNTMIGTCHENARHAASAQNMFNWVGLNDTFVQCTTIEQINPIKAFWIFILPTGLLLATLLGLALALVFANKASTRMFTPIDKAWIAVAVLVIFFALPHFFSPEYKYGLLVVIAALFSILSASIRSKTMNVVTIAVIALVLLYLFDPFTGNSFLSMVTGRLAGGEPDPDRNGLLESTRTVWRNAQEGSIRSCTRFYEYFNHDSALMDYERWDNDAVNTFGYCSRAWAFALLMFTAALFILMGLLFTLALLDLMRFRQPGPHDPYSGFEPIELEVQPTDAQDAIIVE